MKVAVVKETAPGRAPGRPGAGGDRRSCRRRARRAGGDRRGRGAWFADSAYAEAGATIVSQAELRRPPT